MNERLLCCECMQPLDKNGKYCKICQDIITLRKSGNKR